MRIRDARPEDRDAIREVTLAAYQEYAALMPGFWGGYRQNIIVSLDEVGSAEQLVAEDHGAVVGTALLYPPRRMKISRSDSLDTPWPEVRLLAVAPLARGRGGARRSCRNACAGSGRPAAGSSACTPRI
jgi:predicted N-acetyltransferase YhbS